MPDYLFKCENCNNQKKINMSINEFLIFKKENHHCSCDNVTLLKQVVFTPYSRVEKNKEEVVSEAKMEAKKIVEKINRGDEKTIVDYCGDQVNHLK
jgi:hypothetical protein